MKDAGQTTLLFRQLGMRILNYHRKKTSYLTSATIEETAMTNQPDLDVSLQAWGNSRTSIRVTSQHHPTANLFSLATGNVSRGLVIDLWYAVVAVYGISINVFQLFNVGQDNLEEPSS